MVIDEAHRFRNQMTGGYEDLHRICLNKKVILVSATPLNNKLEDLNAQIKLFQPGKNSNIPNISNLDEFFKRQQKMIDKHKKSPPESMLATKQAAKNVRERILNNIMLRRTRSEIIDIYGEDIGKQGVVFPEIVNPEKIIYQFDEATETVFNETIKFLKHLSYARYTPSLYLKKRLGRSEEQAQRNLSGFMRGILVKRLESSFFAFGKTLDRFISSYTNFIEMYVSGTVWISKNVDVFELIYQDNEDKLEELLQHGKAEKYLSDQFVDDYCNKLEQDLQILSSIRDLWKAIGDADPKIESFIQQLKSHQILSNKKILIFTESKETASYIQCRLDKEFPNKVLSYSSQGGMYQKESYSHGTLRKIIEENYDPNNDKQKNDFYVLITTDVLAEGINLHRCGVVINYDLPWNPTRVLQRVGRVNRVGTKHDKIYIFNFFPTAQADEHLGLENNIKGKLQAFHSVMGEDAKYLSEDEEVSAYGLFEKLNSTEKFEDEGFANFEAPYLREIRKIRDDDPALFEKIKNLPKKARTGRMLEDDLAVRDDRVLTFFRKGALKEFVVSDKERAENISFEKAAKLFKCLPNTKRKDFDIKIYHKLLQMNKNHLDKLEEDESIATGGSRSNETQLLNLLRAVQNEQQYTENEKDYIKKVSKALEQGIIPRQTVSNIMKAVKKDKSPFFVLNTLDEYIAKDYLQREEVNASSSQDRSVVLSSYLIGGKNGEK